MELKDLRGIGEKTLFYLNEDGIYSIQDLLLTFPKSYTIYEIQNDNLLLCIPVCISAIIDSKPVFLKYRRNVNTVIFYVLVNNIRLKCVCFSSDYLRYKIFKGTHVTLYGKYKKENKEFMVQNVFFDSFEMKIQTDYKLKNTSNSTMTKAIKNALPLLCIEETLPLELLEKYKLYPIEDYIALSHFPKDKKDYIQIQRRRKYEEFFWYSLSLELLRKNRIGTKKVKREISENMVNNFLNDLSYELTLDQKKAISEIKRDMMMDIPMNRLVQGDVGCGKSIVAYTAALMAISSGFQAVIMVPTELLAVQQYESVKKLFNKLGITVELLTSGIKNKDKEDILYRLRNHRVHVIIGTHALIEETVVFHKLGVVIIDEQHRFGVNQRAKLTSKFCGVDCLYLTATPIPRTLGLTYFGDLDISSIYTMPKNRIPVITRTLDYSRLEELCEIMRNHLYKNEQIYIVAPLVLPNSEIDAYDVQTAYAYFSKVFTEYTIGKVHGKLKPAEKMQQMQDFKSGKTKILISTTVIEVGVDVKNATVMVILDAERYGLAQIHQLRGRVGRSDIQSYCYLLSKIASERLNILCECNNGFDIAVEDFKLRGPGDYLGENQSGFIGLDYADFQMDFKIWEIAKKDGIEYCQKFLDDKIANKKFHELVLKNKMQKGKIN